MSAELTHRVAAAAYIFRAGKVLLLKRTAPPQTFAPPGGRLETGEDPLAGVLREVFEEAGLVPEIIGIAHTWFGRITNGAEPLLCINYLARSDEGEPRLSAEHSEYCWATREEIVAGRVRTQNEHGHGYRPESILEAFERFEAWQTITLR